MSKTDPGCPIRRGGSGYGETAKAYKSSMLIKLDHVVARGQTRPEGGIFLKR